jgi:hypothetical protein
MLAESSQGPKGSILRHMQAGIPGAANRAPTEKKGSSKHTAYHNHKNTHSPCLIVISIAVQKELDIDLLLGARPSTATARAATVAPRLPFAVPQHRAGALSQRAMSQGVGAARPVVAAVGRAAYGARREEPEDFGGADHDNFGYDDAVTDDARLDAAGPGTPITDGPTAGGASEGQDSTAVNTTAAVESSQPKLSLSKGARKLKQSEPTKAADSSSLWGYKPDLSGTMGAAAASFGAIDAGSVAPANGTGAAPAETFSTGTAGKVDPRSWLLHAKTSEAAAVEGVPAAQGEDYVNMFWLDAAENNGVLYLFGKLPLLPEAGTPASAPKKFVSCCVQVHGCERNLFVLPRLVPDTFKEDGTAARMPMVDVYKELSSMLGKSRNTRCLLYSCS